MAARREVMVTQSPVADAVLFGETRMKLEFRLGILLDERADAAGLRAGEVLADDPAGGQVDRKLVVHGVAALAPDQLHEARFAIRVKEAAAFEETRRAGVVERRARPEDALLTVDAVVGDAVVVGDAAAGSEPQLFEDLAGLAEVEELAASRGGVRGRR